VFSSRIRKTHIIAQDAICLLTNTQVMNDRGNNTDGNLGHLERGVSEEVSIKR